MVELLYQNHENRFSKDLFDFKLILYFFLSLFYSFYIDFFSIFTEECYDNQDNQNNEVIRTCSAVKALSEVIFFISFEIQKCRGIDSHVTCMFQNQNQHWIDTWTASEDGNSYFHHKKRGKYSPKI